MLLLHGFDVKYRREIKSQLKYNSGDDLSSNEGNKAKRLWKQLNFALW